MPRDTDGFLVPDDHAPGELRHPGSVVVAPAPGVEMPKVFDGCASLDAAIARMIGELSKPASVELDGMDTLYRRLADAMILILANQGGLLP